MPLNEEQMECVKAANGNILVVAGPGSGKTTTMAHHIAYLINELKIPEDKVKAFTFTVQATIDMQRRINKVIGRKNEVDISNFHSFTFEWLRCYYHINYKVLQDDEKRKIIKKLVEDNKYDIDIDYAMHEISRIKNEMKAKMSTLESRMKIADLYFKYQSYTKKAQKLDFDEMNLSFLIQLRKDEKFRKMISSLFQYIIVDEAQDINNVQYKILQIMSSKYHNLYMVGDPNQSIYAFRGSDLSILDDFKNTLGAKVLHLKNNYRSCKKIVESANKLIKNNTNRFNADSVAVTNEDGEVTYKRPYSSFKQGLYVSSIITDAISKGYTYSDIKILYRNRLSSRNIEMALNQARIPNYVHGMKFLEYQEIKLLLNYLEFALNHNDDEALEAIINNPSRGIGNVTVCDIRLKAMMKKISMFEACQEVAKTNKKVEPFLEVVKDLDKQMGPYRYPTDIINYIINNYIDLESMTKNPNQLRTKKENLEYFLEMAEMEISTKVNSENPLREFLNSLYMKDSEPSKEGVVDLMTIHQSKGLEAKIIIMVDLIDNIIPGKRIDTNIEEERRLFYVGLTRAKEKCYLVAPYSEKEDSTKEYPESRFIDEIKKEEPTIDSSS